ncbi:MAG: hypothetical protein WAN86_14465 [Hyphomicrobiaceae bacterium]
MQQQGPGQGRAGAQEGRAGQQDEAAAGGLGEPVQEGARNTIVRQESADVPGLAGRGPCPRPAADIPQRHKDLPPGHAQQLYLGLHDFATTGKVHANPLIGQIQREAFRDMGVAHADTMRTLDKLIAEMKTINADLQGTPLRPLAPPPAPKPPPVAQIPPGWQACSCPNAHAHAGRYVLGILYHPPGMSCPQ